MQRALRHRIRTSICLSLTIAAGGMVLPSAAEAIVPTIKFVTASSANNSVSPKMAVAVCPAGHAVLGGSALLRGPQGQIAIQSAFPHFDSGLAKWTFVVKAAEEPVTGTPDTWWITADAYCTPTTFPTIVEASSAFDSDPLKHATAECPAGMKVVGLGGEVSTSATVPPSALLGTLPPTTVVFHGMQTDIDLLSVTARATEANAAIGGEFLGNWKVTAVAACAFPLYFDGLEQRTTEEPGGGLALADIESKVSIGCSPGKTPIAGAASVFDHEMGHWYLHRFSRYNAFLKVQLDTESYRNNELGKFLMMHRATVVCVDK
jgi:hypothetical protein